MKTKSFQSLGNQSLSAFNRLQIYKWKFYWPEKQFLDQQQFLLQRSNWKVQMSIFLSWFLTQILLSLFISLGKSSAPTTFDNWLGECEDYLKVSDFVLLRINVLKLITMQGSKVCNQRWLNPRKSFLLSNHYPKHLLFNIQDNNLDEKSLRY